MADEELIYESLGGAGYQVARDYIKDALAKANISIDLGGVEISDILGAVLGFLGHSYLKGPMRTLVRGVLVVSIANIAKSAVNAVKGSLSTSSGSSSAGSTISASSTHGSTNAEYAIVRVLR